MEEIDICLSRAEYAAILCRYSWIRSVDRYASLSRGWTAIFLEMLGVLDEIFADVVAEHADVHAAEWSTKSKFGTLRVSFRLRAVRGPPEPVWSRLGAPIRRAEHYSALTCEVCGAPGRLRSVDDWLLTLCDPHASTGQL